MGSPELLPRRSLQGCASTKTRAGILCACRVHLGSQMPNYFHMCSNAYDPSSTTWSGNMLISLVSSSTNSCLNMSIHMPLYSLSFIEHRLHDTFRTHASTDICKYKLCMSPNGTRKGKTTLSPAIHSCQSASIPDVLLNARKTLPFFLFFGYHPNREGGNLQVYTSLWLWKGVSQRGGGSFSITDCGSTSIAAHFQTHPPGSFSNTSTAHFRTHGDGGGGAIWGGGWGGMGGDGLKASSW